MDGLHHVTLDTGHVRWSPRSEIADDLIALVATHIAAARRRGPADVPRQPGYTARALARHGALAVTVRWQDEAEVVAIYVGATLLDAVTLGVALGEPAPPILQPEPAEAPACLVRLGVGLLDHPAAAAWLGDYERCMAWSWLRGQS